MNPSSFVVGSYPLSTSRRGALLLIVLVMLCHGRLAICNDAGWLYFAISTDALGKVQDLITRNPELVFTGTAFGQLPLQTAAYFGYPDIVKLLLAQSKTA